MAYPVSYEVERPEQYNRLTVAFRLILAIPQLILVGGRGLLTFAAGVLVFLAWFAILFTRRFPVSLRGFVLMVYRWSINVGAYMALQTNPYPPFSGDALYPLHLEIDPAEELNRLTVFFRIFLVIPHGLILALLGPAQSIVTIIAWFAILFTGEYPEGLYRFSVGVSRWVARVTAYMFLLVDEYPPFSLSSDQGTEAQGTPRY